VHIFRDPPTAKLWLNRHKDESSTKTARSAFSHTRVAASVTAANHDVGQRFEILYQQTIDFGAHPNLLAVTCSIDVVKEDGLAHANVSYLGDGPALDMALMTTARCSVCALELIQCVYPARFEKLGISAALPELKRSL
jgi:hypothetical protein